MDPRVKGEVQSLSSACSSMPKQQPQSQTGSPSINHRGTGREVNGKGRAGLLSSKFQHDMALGRAAMAQVDWWVGGDGELAMAVPCEAVSTRPSGPLLCTHCTVHDRPWSHPAE